MNILTKKWAILSRYVKIVLFGFVLWTLWLLFFATVLKLQARLPWWIALISSTNYNYTFALLGIPIWFVCRRIPFSRVPAPVFVFIHFILAVFFSILWLFLCNGLLYIYSGHGKEIFEIIGLKNFIGWQFLMGITNYLLLAGIFYTIIYYRSFRQKELKETELKLLTRDAELKALKLQIHPHFLFNSLNSINALVTQNPQLARQMLSRLSDLLRTSLESHDKLLIPLKEELDIAHTYMDIERIRFGDKMNFQEEVEPELLSKPFPAMLLQPLLENAVKHGVANSRTKGSIKLVLKKHQNQILCEITNDVEPGTSSHKPNAIINGTGLNNICQRLDRLYGKNYIWQIDHSNPRQFRVSISLPLEQADSYENH